MTLKVPEKNCPREEPGHHATPAERLGGAAVSLRDQCRTRPSCQSYMRGTYPFFVLSLSLPLRPFLCLFFSFLNTPANLHALTHLPLRGIRILDVRVCMYMHAFGFRWDGVCVNVAPRQSGGNEQDKITTPYKESEGEKDRKKVRLRMHSNLLTHQYSYRTCTRGVHPQNGRARHE